MTRKFFFHGPASSGKTALTSLFPSHCVTRIPLEVYGQAVTEGELNMLSAVFDGGMMDRRETTIVLEEANPHPWVIEAIESAIRLQPKGLIVISQHPPEAFTPKLPSVAPFTFDEFSIVSFTNKTHQQ
jgi:hypothetical protein